MFHMIAFPCMNKHYIQDLNICLINLNYLSHRLNFQASIPSEARHIHRRDVVKLVNSRPARNAGHGA